MAAAERIAQLQAFLADNPDDPELRYFLAMEHLSTGDEGAAIAILRELTGKTDYVPAFLQAGQILQRQGRIEEARAILRKGVAEAGRQGNFHAQGEMQGLLDLLE